MKSDDKTKINPLYIGSFNQHMFISTFYLLCLIFVYHKYTGIIPKWLTNILFTTALIGVVCGIILCIGYALAIAKGQVMIIELKNKEKK